MKYCKKALQRIGSYAGVRVNGKDPWDMQLHDSAACARILAQGSMGLGESYMDGLWSCKKLDEMVYRLLKANLQNKIKGRSLLLLIIRARIINMQSKSRAFQVGEHHYDLGNDLYEAMLDKNLMYSCGYWKGTDDLGQAQINKMDLICRKLKLEPGMTLLDIGCGWGTLLRFAAKNYGVKCVGVTVSREQAKFARKICEGLPVKIRLKDYRDMDEEFDRIVSVGMFEHVGPKNYREFMKVAHRCLKDDGIFLLHTIGRKRTKAHVDPWINKYIFPNGVIPSMKQISYAMDNLFAVEDVHNFGPYYDRTLMAWNENFQKAWPKLKQRYDERFKRMWEFYLLSCAANFRARRMHLWQFVLCKQGVPGGYESVR